MILYRWYAITRVAFGCWKIEKHWDEPICQKTMTREDQKKSWGKFKTLILNLIWNSNFLYYVVYKIDRSCFELRHIWYSTHLDNFTTFKCFSIMKTNLRKIKLYKSINCQVLSSNYKCILNIYKSYICKDVWTNYN